MREPRMIQGMPRVDDKSKNGGVQAPRKPLPLGLRERINGLALNRPDAELATPPPGSPLLNGMVGRGGNWLI